jgi:hypothetical protein
VLLILLRAPALAVPFYVTNAVVDAELEVTASHAEHVSSGQARVTHKAVSTITAAVIAKVRLAIILVRQQLHVLLQLIETTKIVADFNTDHTRPATACLPRGTPTQEVGVWRADRR